MAPRTVIYDGECRFCRRSVSYMQRRLRRVPAVLPFQSDAVLDLGVDRAACARAVHYVDARGRIWSGGGAVARILVDDGFPLAVAGFVMRAPLVRCIVERAYVWVAANRHRFRGQPAV